MFWLYAFQLTPVYRQCLYIVLLLVVPLSVFQSGSLFEMSQTRKHLKLEEKGKILESIGKGMTVTDLAKQYGVAKSTICGIKKKKQLISQRVAKTFAGPGKLKTLKSSTFPKMERALYKWFIKLREQNIPVSGIMLQEKAKILQKKIDETSTFVASSGWLNRFKQRYGIRLLKISGEKLSSQPELVNPFIEKLRNKIEELKLTPELIYNADESGLYWKLLPDKTYVSDMEKTAPGRKISKQRITFLVGTNALGNHKLKPLLIGKSKNPRCFRNFQCPVYYKSSKTAWMTTQIFKSWFHDMFVPEVSVLFR